MSSGDGGAAPAVRLWWALPFGLALATAVVFVSVVLPALARGPTVPSQLIVHRSPMPAPSTSASITPTPTPTRSTTVVRPEQPVVRDSDDRHEREGPDG
jgi:hypothetical protein